MKIFVKIWCSIFGILGVIAVLGCGFLEIGSKRYYSMHFVDLCKHMEFIPDSLNEEEP